MDFRNTLLAAGLLPRLIVDDGKWYRCSTDDKPRRKNGAYILQPGGTRGFFKNFALDDVFHEWRDDKKMPPIDRADAEERLKLLRQRERERRMKSINAMREYWSALRPLRAGHPYIDAKRLSLSGCAHVRVDGDLLVIPLFRGKHLMSLQTITSAGEKKYRAGCPIKGNAHVIAHRLATVTCLVEGFATGLAVFQSVPESRVIVCFDAGNMVAVAQDLEVKGLCVVCADNDWSGKTNTGVLRGQEAAKALGCGIAYPEGIKGSDWADVLLEWGESGRIKMRMEILRKAKLI